MAIKHSYEYIKKFIESNSNCKLLSIKYKNSQTNLLFKCKCGNEFKASFNSFQSNNKRQCNQCGKQSFASKITKTNEEFVSEVYDMVGNEYIFLEKYQGVQTKILCRHNKCKHEYYVRPNHFLTGSRCPLCSGVNKTNEEFLQEVYNLVDDEYIFLEEYQGSNIKIKCKHNIDSCEYIWKTAPTSFLSGRRCPQCNESKGERVIRVHLESINIKYKQEYTFKDLIGVGGGLLRFDFAIFNNNNLTLLIEYDGEQHFEFNEGMMTKGDYKTLQIHDQLKDEYCKKQDIKLLRIPYWNFDKIEEILLLKLESFSKRKW